MSPEHMSYTIQNNFIHFYLLKRQLQNLDSLSGEFLIFLRIWVVLNLKRL
jgi:hypothetical protein